jgi:mRNA-degrading endonuclease RelE of RelBE toxin-antitoxin system
MQYRIIIKPRAEREANKLSNTLKRRVCIAAKRLESNPYIGKKLKGEYRGQHVLRVWPYRIIYYIYKKERVIIILRIAYRQNTY